MAEQRPKFPKHRERIPGTRGQLRYCMLCGTYGVATHVLRTGFMGDDVLDVTTCSEHDDREIVLDHFIELQRASRRAVRDEDRARRDADRQLQRRFEQHRAAGDTECLVRLYTLHVGVDPRTLAWVVSVAEFDDLVLTTNRDSLEDALVDAQVVLGERLAGYLQRGKHPPRPRLMPTHWGWWLPSEPTSADADMKEEPA